MSLGFIKAPSKHIWAGFENDIWDLRLVRGNEVVKVPALIPELSIFSLTKHQATSLIVKRRCCFLTVPKYPNIWKLFLVFSYGKITYLFLLYKNLWFLWFVQVVLSRFDYLCSSWFLRVNCGFIFLLKVFMPMSTFLSTSTPLTVKLADSEGKLKPINYHLNSMYIP